MALFLSDFTFTMIVSLPSLPPSLQLTVTAVPPLPSNLTYNCSFSANGDIFPLLVEAVEVEAGTVYQCNITAVITDLDSVREGLPLLVQSSCVLLHILPLVCSD